MIDYPGNVRGEETGPGGPVRTRGSALRAQNYFHQVWLSTI